MAEELYGLVGYPIKHSYSPLMHNAVFKTLGIQGEYRLFEIFLPELDNFIKSLDKNNIKGLNVTLPYKEKVLNFLDLSRSDENAVRIGAVNTIVKSENKLIGYNTDILGFSRHIKEYISLKDKRVAVLGAGGAARAVCYVLLQEGVKSISIFDIRREKSDSLVSLMENLFPSSSINRADSIDDLAVSEKDILINATPVGLKKEDPLIIDSMYLHSDLFVYDLIYNPNRTKLLEEAERIGCKVSNGLGMLIYQAAFSFLYFTGIDESVETIIKIMNEAITKELGNV